MGSNYLLKEGFKNVFKNKRSTMISLITMILAMFLFGAFFSIGENVNYVLEQVQKEQGIEVFIEREATDEEIGILEESINRLEGINTVTFKSKQKALEYMREQLKDIEELFDEYEGENNIFRASFVITLSDLSMAQEIENKISEMDNVAKITSNNETISTLMKIANYIRIAIGIIFIILLIISVTIISNTIKLTVYARRKEISIMKYVGATNGFIRWPFIIEGIIIGIIAAIITLLIIGEIYDIIAQSMSSSDVLQKIGINLLQFPELVKTISIVYGGLGIGVGVIGSSISMKKYLEV